MKCGEWGRRVCFLPLSGSNERITWHGGADIPVCPARTGRNACPTTKIGDSPAFAFHYCGRNPPGVSPMTRHRVVRWIIRALVAAACMALCLGGWVAFSYVQYSKGIRVASGEAGHFSDIPGAGRALDGFQAEGPIRYVVLNHYRFGYISIYVSGAMDPESVRTALREYQYIGMDPAARPEPPAEISRASRELDHGGVPTWSGSFRLISGCSGPCSILLGYDCGSHVFRGVINRDFDNEVRGCKEVWGRP